MRCDVHTVHTRSAKIDDSGPNDGRTEETDDEEISTDPYTQSVVNSLELVDQLAQLNIIAEAVESRRRQLARKGT